MMEVRARASIAQNAARREVRRLRMRLRQLALVARELEPVVDDLCAVLAVDVAYRDPGVSAFGLHNALLALGDTFLEVVSPTQPGTTAGRLLEKRGGDGGYMVIVQVDGRDLDFVVERKRLAAQQVRVAWETKLADIATLHLHPRDVGAAILSLDASVPAEAWRWAGPNWTGAADPAQAGRRDAIMSARLQSTDPAGLAERWSRVLDRPVVQGAGALTLPLDEGSIEFTAVTDGRGDGLAGMTIRVADREASLAAARARSLPITDGRVTIAGAQLRLL
jgi:hypothetical protein